MNEHTPRLEQARANVAGLVGDVFAAGDGAVSVTDAELLAVLRELGAIGRLVDAAVVACVAEVLSRSAGFARDERLTTLAGCRDAVELTQRALLADRAQASRIVAVAKGVRREPRLDGTPRPARYEALRGVLLAGDLSVAGFLAATQELDRAGARVGAADRELADAELAGIARGVGYVPVAGAAAAGSGADEASAAPVFPKRLREQILHDVFATVVNVAARSAEVPALGGAAPTLVVSIDVETLARGTGYAELDGADLVTTYAVAEQTACTGVIQRVFQDRGRIVRLETTERVFTAAQRRAIVRRDRECIIPGCHVSANWCEIHHVLEHSLGGPTHTDNGVLVCFHHHRTLHCGGWSIRMRDGRPEIRGPAGWDPSRAWRIPDARQRGSSALSTASGWARSADRPSSRGPSGSRAASSATRPAAASERRAPAIRSRRPAGAGAIAGPWPPAPPDDPPSPIRAPLPPGPPASPRWASPPPGS